MAKQVSHVRSRAVKLTDSRVRLTNEILSGIRVVKLNGWAPAFLARIDAIRIDELAWIRRASFLRSANSTVKDSVTPLACLATFSTYAAIHGGHLPAATAFTVLALFSIMVRIFAIAPQGLQYLGEAIVAVQRLQKFLLLPNGKGSSNGQEKEQLMKSFPQFDMVALNAFFSWRVRSPLSQDGGPNQNDASIPPNSSQSIHQPTHPAANGQEEPSPRLAGYNEKGKTFSLGRSLRRTGSLSLLWDSLSVRMHGRLGASESFRRAETPRVTETRAEMSRRHGQPGSFRKSASSRKRGSGRSFSLSRSARRSRHHAAIDGNFTGQGNFELPEVNLSIRKGSVVGITGSVGSGKSSLLQALLGEMESIGGRHYSSSPVAYAPQQPWILNSTVRNNIIFGLPFDAARYTRVVECCALVHDVALLPQGHDTEIGERGVNLSGGQKARLSLARACYSNAQLVFLDDPFAAVDLPTGRHLMEQLLSERVVEGRGKRSGEAVSAEVGMDDEGEDSENATVEERKQGEEGEVENRAGFLREEDRTVVLVTHNTSALRFCSVLYEMEDGRLKEVAEVPQEAEKGKGGGGEVDGREEEGALQELCVTSDEEESSKAGVDEAGAEGNRGEGRGHEDGTEGEGACGREGTTGSKGGKDGGEKGQAGEGEGENMIGRLNGAKSPGAEPAAEERGKGGRGEGEGAGTGEEGDNAGCGEGAGADAAAAAEGGGGGGVDGGGGGLTVKEDRVEGNVQAKAYVAYIMGGGGLPLLLLLIVSFIFAQSVRTSVDWWLGVWVDAQYSLSSADYILAFAILTLSAAILSLARGFLFTFMALRSARHLHQQMAERVLRSPQLFFDQNPLGRIVNRFSKDQAFVDELLPNTAQTTLEYFLSVAGSAVIIAIFIPWILLLILPCALVFLHIQQRYVRVSRELKRIDGLTRSPIYAHFSLTMQGASSVRAFAVAPSFIRTFVSLIDANHSAYILFAHAARWLGTRLDFCASVVVGVVALCVVLLRHSLQPGVAGVVLVQSLQLIGLFSYAVRQAAETENYFTSVERIHTYTQLPSEANSDTPPGVIGSDWPEEGQLDVQGLCLAYRDDLPYVLRDVSFKVQAGQKVGIVGRTGAGKSSLATALFRLVENSKSRGRILIDGVDTRRVGLDDLRQRLSIIPQDPVLFQGSIRQNLDPFSIHSDLDLFESLRKVHLFAKVSSLPGGLDAEVAENGENFSVGQRQLLCLARALLRRSRIIIMDEATAAVDASTDALIQRTMRTVFASCTVLTIAHRIDTVIDCDAVLVLKAGSAGGGGECAEFGPPAELLKNPAVPIDDESSSAGIFSTMVARAGRAQAEELKKAALEAEERRRQRLDGRMS